jgi:hypothetical protein
MRNLAILFFIGFLMSSWSQRGVGVAPSLPSEYTRKNIESINYKNGQMVVDQNGWQATLDTTDPVNHQTTSNGWIIEVKYE